MGDLLRDAQIWLADQLQKHVASEVTYKRGTQQVTVRATIGRTLLSLDNEFGGTRMEWTDRDFLIRAVDLKFGAAAVVPQRGDRIMESVNGQTLSFEVLAPADEPVWRWADPHRQMLRIHTKLVGTA
jgi:hypothetical protein